MAQIKKSLYKVLFLNLPRNFYNMFYVLQTTETFGHHCFSPILFFARDSSINSSKTYAIGPRRTLAREIELHNLVFAEPSPDIFSQIYTDDTNDIKMVLLIIVIIYGLHVYNLCVLNSGVWIYFMRDRLV